MMDFAYTIPKNREINPSFYSIIFFPFMFGVMFGDIGHGIITLLLVIFLFRRKNDDLIESFKYLLLLVSIFSIFCGFIYNDFFSLPIILQRSCYYKEKNHFL